MITWKKIINNEKKKIYFINIIKFLNKEYKISNIFPNKKKIFKVFKLTKFNKIKIVILGQDPYYKKNQANGLAFSISKKIKITQCIKNIYKEIKNEFPKFKIPNHGCLKKWSKQGILLLNSILTVKENKPLSHKNIGWEIFTNNIIKYINKYLNNIIFLLWGNYAKKKIKFINKNKHIILCTSHPSPLSINKGFLGCNHFKKVNKILKKKNIKIIKW